MVNQFWHKLYCQLIYIYIHKCTFKYINKKQMFYENSSGLHFNYHPFQNVTRNVLILDYTSIWHDYYICTGMKGGLFRHQLIRPDHLHEYDSSSYIYPKIHIPLISDNSDFTPTLFEEAETSMTTIWSMTTTVMKAMVHWSPHTAVTRILLKSPAVSKSIR